MCSDDGGSAEETLAHDRRYYQRRILLRHAERLAVDVLIDDEIADHDHFERWKSGDDGIEILKRKPVAVGIVARLGNVGAAGLLQFLLQQIDQREARVPGGEQQLAAIALEDLLLGVG